MSNNKKYVSLARLSNFLENIKSKYSQIGHKHTIADLSDYRVDTALSPTSSNPVANSVLDAEFDAMATAMGALELAIDGKSDSAHNHNDLYYTEAEINQKLASKSDSTHNHDDKYDAKGAAADSLASAKSYTDTKTSNLASTTVVDNKVSSHNTSTSSHSDIRDLITGLTTRLNTLANSDDTTLDQMSEVVAYIKNNKNLIDGITTNKVNVSDIVNNLTTNVSNKPLSAAQGVAIKNLIDALQEELDSHGHAISDVSGLQSALDGKAASSHGTHVSYSTTAPVMDGTASVGSASTVARSDHKHPTDTSRAAKTDLDSHTSNKSNPHGVTISQLGVTATATELNYVDGVTSNIQTQLNGKLPASNGIATNLAVVSTTADETKGFKIARNSAIDDEYVTHYLDDSSYTMKYYNDETSNSIKMVLVSTDTESGTGANKSESSITFANSGNKSTVTANTFIGALSGTATKATQDASGNVITSTYATKSELNSAKTNLQSSIDSKQSAITGAATTITGSNLTANRALISNGSGKVTVSAITNTELGHLDGAISNIQTQLDERRTHWIECGSGVILSSRSVSNNATLSGLSNVTPPDCIVVTFDNVEYKCVMWTNSFGEKCYGDSRIAETTDMTNPENTPFYINACADDGADFSLVWTWYIVFNSNISSTSHTIKINEAEYRVISENFIPNTIARASAVSQVQIITWEAND